MSLTGFPHPTYRSGSTSVKLANSNDRAVLVLGEEIADVSEASEGRFGPHPMSVYEDWTAFVDFAQGVTSGRAPLDLADLGCPVPTPRQVFAIGLNYRSHAEETGMAAPDVPATFTKVPSSLAGPFDEVEIVGDSVDWESNWLG
jgi:2-keto-4-pentenoate hydratase/2-oxohepta-3-ene-1,7-dioic acid hydratase in catechol pathway